MEIVVHKPEPLKGALLLVGFPSRGLVGGIAVNYVIEDLKMWHIASLYDPQLPPTVVIKDGVADSPIQFFASAERCGPDGNCDRLLACLSDVPLEPTLLAHVAHTIVKWAKANQVKHIVVLEGMESTNTQAGMHDDDAPHSSIKGVRSMTSKHRLAKYKVETVKEGIVSSYASAFLLAANEHKVDLVALYIESHASLPDARGAARLLKRVDEMLPNINFESRILEKRATEIETKVKHGIEKSARDMTSMRRGLEFMYQ